MEEVKTDSKKSAKNIVSFFVDEMVGGFFVVVPPGHIACIHDLGRGVLAKVYKPGLHFKIPFWQIAKLFNSQILEFNISDEFNLNHKEALGSRAINAITSDNKEITVEGSVLFRIDKENAFEIWENIGEEFVSKVVRPLTTSRILAIVSEFSLHQLNGQRRDFEYKVKELLVKDFENKGLICEGFLLNEIKER